MTIAAKPYTITWPLTAGSATEIDQMFDQLFTNLRTSAIGEGNAATLVVPTFTKGSILYVPDTVGTIAGLAVSSSAGAFVRSDGSLPLWSTITLPNSAVTGDILYASAANAYGNLAGVATGNALLSGGVGVAPVWGDIDLTTTVTGILPVINGGTSLNTITLGRIIIGNGTGVPTLLSPGTTGVVLRGNSSTAWNVSTWTIVNAFAQGSIPYASTTNILEALAVGAAGTILVGGATIPSYSAAPTITTSVTTARVFIGNGLVGTPSLAFTDEVTTGFFKPSSNTIDVVTSSVSRIRLSEASFESTVGFSMGATTGAADVLLSRGAANVLQMRNGTASQSMRFGPSGSYLEFFKGNAADGYITNLDDVPLNFGVNNTAQWKIVSGGHFQAATDNVHDIGASGATRPRTGYFGTSIFNPLLIGGTAVGATLTLKSTTGIGVNDAIIGLIGTNGSVEVMRLNSTNAKFTSPLLVSCSGGHVITSALVGDQNLSVVNLLAGTGNSASIIIGTDATNNFTITGFSSTYTPSGYAFPNGGAIGNAGDGGLSFAQTGAGDIRFYTSGAVTLRMTIATGGTITTTGPLRTNGAVTGFLSVVSGTAFGQGFQVLSAAKDSMLETTYNGTYFLVDSTYQTSEGYKDVVFNTSGGQRLRLEADGDVLVGTGTALKIHASGGASLGNTVDPGATNLSVTGTIGIIGKITPYNNIVTTGWGIPAIYGTGRSAAQTAAVASVATYTVGAADGSFLISANVNVTTSTLHNFTVTCAYTDETNTARVQTLPFVQLAGTPLTAITNATGVGPYESLALQIRCKASTAITIATFGAGGFTTVTYNVEASITQVS